MPPDDPPDDFSQLPTADGKPPRSPGLPPARRQQTRIGPRRAAPEEAPAPDHAPTQLSDDWNELLQSTHLPETPASSWAEWPVETAPPPAPRRTVVGRRTPIPESTPPIPEEPPAPEPQPETQPVPQEPAAEKPTVSQTKTRISKPPETESEKKSDTPSGSATSEDPTPPSDKPKSLPEEAAPPTGPWHQRWERWGGRALTLSVGIHVLLLLGGATLVVTQVMEPEVDFLPGGGTQQSAAASQALEHKIQQKKSPWLKKAMPVRKIAAAGAISDIVLPDEMPDLLELPQSKDLLSGGGKLTAGMGLAGAGGGFGKSMGLGSQSGMVFQPFSMFGMQIKAKKLALVLDVSTSMAPHLPRVIEEVDKVAKGSVVILYFGCGLEPPPPQGLDGDEVYSTSSVEFEKFWRLGGASLEETRKFRIDPKNEIQNEAIFRMLSKRPQTYFIHNTGLGYTWLALLNDKVRLADGIYWFSDFQDRVDFRQVNIVRENLERRKQRLYMHAYMQGSSYDLVRTQLVEPTQGDVKLEE